MRKIIFLLLSCIVAQGSVNAMEESLLHFAATSGNLEQVRRLLLLPGIDANARTQWADTPLHLAAVNGCRTVVHELLQDRRANINAQNRDGETPLHLAVRKGCLTSVQELLQDDRIDATRKDNSGKTPLALAEREYRRVHLEDHGLLDTCTTPLPILQMIRRYFNQQILALVMATHPRLGANSPVSLCDRNVLQNIHMYLNGQ
jgi:hypothetical protein